MLTHLAPLIQKTGSTLSPEEFHEKVNIVFHNFESEQYDHLHQNMWQSLQEQVDLLVNDLPHIPEKGLKLLDIGCGTGLSTKLILDSKIGPAVALATLLDTSPQMLKQAEKKASGWNVPYTLVNGHLHSVDEKFDIIIICSVLHHIPELAVFLKEVEQKLNADGILIHLQDPNFDFLQDIIYLENKNEYRKHLNSKKKKFRSSNLVPKKLKRTLKRWLGRYDYIDKINNQLLRENIIKKRMSADDLWSVTDLHVETNEVTKGISLSFLKFQLTGFNLINIRSYGFYGFLKSELSDAYREKEEKYISENHKNGRFLSGIWIKK
ncbi:class I SAM-dependent methyltransferase [Ascidiimonas aurantiaca]|uniref:class I SAM-dependent methyltransferase n=1 Tax=Ascidiimonas aurantiaca TaxID=1685432 RepID=UPI0030ECB313